MRVRQVSLIALLGLLVGCSPSSVPLAPPAHEPAEDTMQPPVPGFSPTSTRTLPVGALFRDLVEAARELEEHGATDSAGECGLRRRASGHWYLESELASGVNPLPSGIPDLLDELRSGVTRWQVLSRWGAFGPASADVVLASVTGQAPGAGDENLVLLAISERRVVWSAIGDADWGGEAEDVSAELLESLGTLSPDAILVTAEPDTSLSRMERVLERFQEGRDRRVGVVVALPMGTTLPDREAASSNVGMCSDAEDVSGPSTSGGRSAGDIGLGLQPLREGVARCLASAGGGGNAGGLLRVHLRIAASGEVLNVCAQQDDIEAVTLRLCILERIRALRFNEAAGPDEVLLPLRLVSPSRPSRELFCGD